MTESALDDLPPARRLSLPLVIGFWSIIAVLSAANGWLDRERTILEVLTSIRRAGADMILTYWAAEAAAWLD